MHDYEKKVRKVSFCTTIQEVMFDVFDPGRLLEVLGVQWDENFALNRPAKMFSVMSFLQKIPSLMNGF